MISPHISKSSTKFSVTNFTSWTEDSATLQSWTYWQSTVTWSELQNIKMHVHPHNQFTLQKFIWSQAAWNYHSKINKVHNGMYFEMLLTLEYMALKISWWHTTGTSWVYVKTWHEGKKWGSRGITVANHDLCTGREWVGDAQLPWRKTQYQ